MKIKLDGVEYLIMKETDILGTLAKLRPREQFG
jgi:co-chaperonin GroES (HSP10)